MRRVCVIILIKGYSLQFRQVCAFTAQTVRKRKFRGHMAIAERFCIVTVQLVRTIRLIKEHSTLTKDSDLGR